jgi:hypothetical protein
VLNKLYLTLGSLILVGYSVVAFNGWEFGDEPRGVVPADQLHSGSYRSSGFWHSGGFRGGK